MSDDTTQAADETTPVDGNTHPVPAGTHELEGPDATPSDTETSETGGAETEADDDVDLDTIARSFDDIESALRRLDEGTYLDAT